MTQIDDFREQISQLTARLAGRALDAELQTWLNLEFGPDSGLDVRAGGGRYSLRARLQGR